MGELKGVGRVVILGGKVRGKDGTSSGITWRDVLGLMAIFRRHNYKQIVLDLFILDAAHDFRVRVLTVNIYLMLLHELP